jgi:hypothetical protein
VVLLFQKRSKALVLLRRSLGEADPEGLGPVGVPPVKFVVQVAFIAAGPIAINLFFS